MILGILDLLLTNQKKIKLSMFVSIFMCKCTSSAQIIKTYCIIWWSIRAPCWIKEPENWKYSISLLTLPSTLKSQFRDTGCSKWLKSLFCFYIFMLQFNIFWQRNKAKNLMYYMLYKVKSIINRNCVIYYKNVSKIFLCRK